MPASARRSACRRARRARPAIRLCDEPRAGRGPALADRLLRGVEHEARGGGPAHRPADGEAPPAAGPRPRRTRAWAWAWAWASVAKATWTGPCQAATQAKPPTHSRSGAGASSWRLARSSGHGAAGPRTVLLTALPRTAPRSPIARIGRASRAAATPSRLSRRQALLAPWTAKFPPRTRAISGRSPASRRWRAERLLGSRRAATCAWQACGAIGSSRQRPPGHRSGIGRAPWAARCAPTSATIASAGGRAPPPQSTPMPCAGSPRPAGLPEPRARAPECDRAPPCPAPAARPRRAPPAGPGSASRPPPPPDPRRDPMDRRPPAPLRPAGPAHRPPPLHDPSLPRVEPPAKPERFSSLRRRARWRRRRRRGCPWAWGTPSGRGSMRGVPGAASALPSATVRLVSARCFPTIASAGARARGSGRSARSEVGMAMG